MTERTFLDVKVDVYMDDDDPKHATIEVGTRLGDNEDQDFPDVDQETLRAGGHYLAGMFARVAHDLALDVRAQRAVHGCRVGAVYATELLPEGRERRLKPGAPYPDPERERIEVYDDESCHVHVGNWRSLEWPVPYLLVTIPRNRRGIWRKRVQQLLGEYAEAIPRR